MSEMDAVWALRVSNPRPPRCKRGALATELSAQANPNSKNQIPRTKFIGIQNLVLGIWNFGFVSYMENELPQPQVLLALGLLMLKPRRFRSSWKSTVTLSRYIKLRLSTTTG